jgi:hypothetical protein
MDAMTLVRRNRVNWAAVVAELGEAEARKVAELVGKRRAFALHLERVGEPRSLRIPRSEISRLLVERASRLAAELPDLLLRDALEDGAALRSGYVGISAELSAVVMTCTRPGVRLRLSALCSDQGAYAVVDVASAEDPARRQARYVLTLQGRATWPSVRSMVAGRPVANQDAARRVALLEILEARPGVPVTLRQIEAEAAEAGISAGHVRRLLPTIAHAAIVWDGTDHGDGWLVERVVVERPDAWDRE